jgi:hypothetical protein
MMDYSWMPAPKIKGNTPPDGGVPVVSEDKRELLFQSGRGVARGASEKS